MRMASVEIPLSGPRIDIKALHGSLRNIHLLRPLLASLAPPGCGAARSLGGGIETEEGDAGISAVRFGAASASLLPRGGDDGEEMNWRGRWRRPAMDLRECPEELREAIAGLIFAESPCGELPELHEVRFILASRLGKEFVAAAVELRNNCGVNSRIIQKMSTKQVSLESRTKVTKDIAAELGIALHLEEAEESSSELPTQLPSSTTKQPDAAAVAVVYGFARDEYLSESVNVRERYKNAASAAQAAFECATYAAAAARAAVKLSRSESQGKVGPGDQSSPRAPAKATSGGRSYPVQNSGSETESEKEMERSVKPVPFPREWEKRMADDASEEDDEESEEEGVGRELMGNRPSPMQSSAPGSRNRQEHGFQGQRDIGVRSDDDTSFEEEEEEIKVMLFFALPLLLLPFSWSLFFDIYKYDTAFRILKSRPLSIREEREVSALRK